MPSSATNIPQFDEQSGTRLIAEEEFPATDGSQPAADVLVLPWREWHRENTRGTLEADKASAVAVLHGLHENFDVTIQPVELNYINNKPRVFATTIIEKGMVWLPPCVPKQSRVLDHSENPNASSLWVVLTRSTEAAFNHPDGHIIRSRECKVVPEFKAPTQADPAIGSQPAVADFKNEKHSIDGKWILDDGTPDAMHPFWAARRLTNQQLQKERHETKAGEWLPRFTCEIAYHQLSEVCVYSMVRCDNRTKNIAVPFITCLLYTSPSPRDLSTSRMPSSA